MNQAELSDYWLG